MNILYPNNIEKYFGTIYQRKNKFQVKIKTDENNICKTFDNYFLACEYLKGKNHELNLPIKNKIMQYPDRCEMEITRGMYAIIDENDTNKVDQLIWCSQFRKQGSSFYVAARKDTKIIYLHNYLLNHEPNELTIDHINRNGLDNRKNNLRIVNKAIQTINQQISTRNKSGARGIALNNGNYTATWVSADGNNKTKSFSIKRYGNEEAKQLAIEYRQQMINVLPNYHEALNL